MLKQMPSWRKKDQPSVHKIKTNTPTKKKRVFVSSHRWLRAAITSPTSILLHSVNMATFCPFGFSQEQQQAQGCSGMLGDAPSTAHLLSRLPTQMDPKLRATPVRPQQDPLSCRHGLPSPSHRNLKSNSV